jgi:uncharacterized protein (TIGR02217 family)
MAFHEVQFPPVISYGSSGGPGFNTNIISVDSGQEERVARRGQARCQYEVSSGLKKQEDVYALVTFFRARMGSAYGFRFKDWSDYATSASGVTYAAPAGKLVDVISNVDTVIGTGDGATTAFQLTKTYTSGPVSRSRKVTKPVSGTVLVAVDGVDKAGHFTVDTTSGVVTLDAAPANGAVVSAGFEFDVPVRFGDDVDKGLSVNLEDYRSGSMQVPLIELLDEGESSDEFFYGGAQENELVADFPITGVVRVWVFKATAAGKKVTLPAITGMPGGGPHFFIVNDGTSPNTFVLADASGVTITTVNAGAGVEVYVSRDAVGTRVWYVK